MYITLPKGINVDIDNVPDDLEKEVQSQRNQFPHL